MRRDNTANQRGILQKCTEVDTMLLYFPSIAWKVVPFHATSEVLASWKRMYMRSSGTPRCAVTMGNILAAWALFSSSPSLPVGRIMRMYQVQKSHLCTWRKHWHMVHHCPQTTLACQESPNEETVHYNSTSNCHNAQCAFCQVCFPSNRTSWDIS